VLTIAESAIRFSPLGEPAPRSVAILRALHLGDLLCAVPAFRALRAALPSARIVLVGLPWARAVVERFARYLDGFLEFPGYPGLPEQPPRLDEIPAFLESAQREHFDLALQMHDSGPITNPLTVLLGARLNAGFFQPGQYCPDPGRFLAYPVNVPEVWRHLQLMAFLGVPLLGEELEFPVTEEDRRSLHRLERVEDFLDQPYVCVYPGARSATRRWAPEQFGTVANALADRGLRVVLTGSVEEAPLTAVVASAMQAPTLDLAGRTSLGALAALLEGARLVVCNDNGVSHLTAALRVPSVIVFHRLAECQGWSPRDRQRHRIVSRLTGVTPADVITEADDLLRQYAERATEAVKWSGLGSSEVLAEDGDVLVTNPGPIGE
jgi:ADP-heptose:LPS heptosyltransferase